MVLTSLMKGHRGDYHEEFLRRVRELEIRIQMGSDVVSYDEDAPSITLASGEVHRADVVVAADGKPSSPTVLPINLET